MAKRKKHVGSSLDSLLEETGDLSEVNAQAIKQVIAWEVSQKMKAEGISKTKMAESMKTSRSSLDRLLDPTNSSVTLDTLNKAAWAVGKTLRIELS